MIDVKKIRKDFPQLDGEDYHYLDAAASSLTPNSVLCAVIEYYTSYRANVHRALFTEAVKATEKYESTRKKVAAFINADSPDEIIFTSGATESSNILVRMFEETFKWEEEEKNIVTTEMEHHGALVPLQQLAQRADLALKFIPMHEFLLDYEKAETIIDKDTVVVSVMLASNVTGVINDVRKIADMAHKHGSIMVVDATAAAGHVTVDVKALGADALYFSGHKMFAPTGVGVLWIKKELLERLEPSSFGGHMINHVEKEKAVWAPIPERFEAGTKNIAGVIGLGEAIDYINKIGLDDIHAHNGMLAFMAIQKLETIPGVKVYSPCDPKINSGTVSFVCDFAHPHDVAEVLARERVAVRPGHHCAIPLHTALGISATTRASFHIYNTKEDVDALVEGIKKVKEIFSEAQSTSH